MTAKLNEYDIQFLIDKLQKKEPIPEDYKYKLFPMTIILRIRINTEG